MSRGVTRAKAAAPPEMASRIDAIAEIMRAGAWVRGSSVVEMAAEWGIAVSTAENYSAEAWRRVCAEADDAAQVRPTIAGTLAVALAQSAAAQSHKTTAMLADTWSKVVGARAAERHEHAVVVAQYEALPREGKVAWLRERAKRMLAEADLLEADESG